MDVSLVEIIPRKSSIRTDGSREKIRIADVRGRFQKWKGRVFLALILIYALVPWIQVKGHPLILIDILHRRFYLFGQTFNAQDFYLIFFLITGGAFALFYITALAGRVWCGWACPQTVFLEGVFRRIERWIEGPRSSQILLSRQGLTGEKIRKFILKHGLYLMMALLVSHIFISYFVSLKELFHFIRHDPREHWVAFLWMGAITGVIYFNFAWFREQLCLVVCPYGRIQSALTDDDTLMIAYDVNRGEPRGKKKDLNRGDCISCNRCVDVCPTGIDIRAGLQLECIGCANCIDACDDIMGKIGQAPGLIRYDSLNGFQGKGRRFLRPRIALYTILLFIGMAVFSYFLVARPPFEANLLRLPGAPYVITETEIRNQFNIHLTNKTPEAAVFSIHPSAEAKVIFIQPIKEIRLESLEGRTLPLFVQMDRKDYQGQFSIFVEVVDLGTKQRVSSQMPFLGP